MNIVVLVHDNEVYGMTKKQASPTSPQGLKTSTTPSGSFLEPLNILSTTLGVTNASFVANAVEWIPEQLYEIIHAAFQHKGLSFVRIAQRCPHFLPNFFDCLIDDPRKIMLLKHENGVQVSDQLGEVYDNQLEHDPSDINRAREVAEMKDVEPVGILYRDESVPCYDEIRRPKKAISMVMRKEAMNREFDKFAVNLDA